MSRLLVARPARIPSTNPLPRMHGPRTFEPRGGRDPAQLPLNNGWCSERRYDATLVNLRHMGRNSLLAAIGLAASGLSTVAVTALASRSFPGAAFATFSVWWTLALTIGLCFTLLETYLPKALGDALLRGEGAPVQRTMARRVVIALSCFVLLAAAGGSETTGRWLSGSVPLLLLAIAYVCVLALQSFQRGVAVARGNFPAMAWQMTTDGVIRVVLALSLTLTGHSSPQSMASIIVVAGAVSLAVGQLVGPGWWAWRGDRARLSWFPLGALFVAALGPAVMNNATVPWLSAQQGMDPYAIGAFAGALALSRIPIMFVGAVYAPVIRPLADATVRGDLDGFRRTYRLVVAFGLGLAALSALLGWTLGPWLVSLYLGHQYSVAPSVTAALALMGGLGLMGAGSQAAVVAQDRWEASPRASAAGLAVFGLILALVPRWSPPMTAAIAGLTGVSVIVIVVMSHVRGVSLVPGRHSRAARV